MLGDCVETVFAVYMVSSALPIVHTHPGTPYSSPVEAFQSDCSLGAHHRPILRILRNAEYIRSNFADPSCGFTAYGRIVTAVEKQQQHALPIGLIGPHVRLKRPVKQGTILTYDDVEFTEQPFIVTLRELLDRGAAREVG
jgi:hypothetical protein